jgi:hypothetical protein
MHAAAKRLCSVGRFAGAPLSLVGSNVRNAPVLAE